MDTNNYHKYVVVSTNNNPDYMWFVPYIEKAWSNYGWKLCIMITSDVDSKALKVNLDTTIICRLPHIPELRTETIAQVGRLYAANYLPVNSLIMTSDMDLLPLTDYWKPEYNYITVYGHDLTWYSYYPMGYTAMSTSNWMKYMNIHYNTKEEILRDAKELGTAFSDLWEEWWNYDWRLLTQRLKPYAENIKFINRGQVSIAGADLAVGRVDRYAWNETAAQSNWIDAHCPNNNTSHPDKVEAFMNVYNKIHG